jgi:hypothetical protein
VNRRHKVVLGIAAFVGAAALPLQFSAAGDSSGPAAAAEIPGVDEKLVARLEADAVEWRKARSAALDMAAQFSNAAKGKEPGYREFIENLLSRMDILERDGETRRAALERKIRADAASGKLSDRAAKKQLGFVDRVFRLRMLYLYGYLAPASISEFEKNWEWTDGPSWPPKLKEAEFHGVQAALIGRSTISKDDFASGKPWNYPDYGAR